MVAAHQGHIRGIKTRTASAGRSMRELCTSRKNNFTLEMGSLCFPRYHLLWAHYSYSIGLSGGLKRGTRSHFGQASRLRLAERVFSQPRRCDWTPRAALPYQGGSHDDRARSRGGEWKEEREKKILWFILINWCIIVSPFSFLVLFCCNFVVCSSSLHAVDNKPCCCFFH